MLRNKTSNKSKAHIFVSGRVQGVFFRANTKKKANQLGLTGRVRNLSDGRVEIVLEGDKDKIKRMIDWAHNGSRSARVDDVEIGWEEYSNEFSKFEIKH